MLFLYAYTFIHLRGHFFNNTDGLTIIFNSLFVSVISNTLTFKVRD